MRDHDGATRVRRTFLKFEIYTDAVGTYRWRLLASDGQVGTSALIQQCVRELAEEDARADHFVRLRVLTDALAHMPLET